MKFYDFWGGVIFFSEVLNRKDGLFNLRIKSLALFKGGFHHDIFHCRL